MQKNSKPDNIKNALRDIFAGSVGGFVQCFVGHPFDTVKVREFEFSNS